jgi:hypothetical protein
MSTETDSLDMDITATATSGVQIPMKIVVTFPKGYGLYAAKSIEALPANMDAIYNELIQKQDASVIAVLLENGHEDEEGEI